MAFISLHLHKLAFSQVMCVKRLFVDSHRILSLVSLFFSIVSFVEMLEIPLIVVTIHDLAKTFCNQSNILIGLENDPSNYGERKRIDERNK